MINSPQATQIASKYRETQAKLTSNMIDKWEIKENIIHINMKDGSTLSINKETALAFKGAPTT